MLDVDRLSVSYGPVKALSEVSFHARDDSITAVLGANGAGKTTLLRAITGLAPIRGGTVRMNGTSIGGLPPEEIVRRGVSHVPEGRGVITELTVEENLRLGALWRKRSSDHTEAIDRAYALFPPLESRRHRIAATLSGGERQMLAIGRALAAQPSVLLLDEPSLGLAPLVTAELMRVIRDLAKQGLTVVLVEQNAMSALLVADRAVVLHVGSVQADDRADVVRNDENLRHYYLGVSA